MAALAGTWFEAAWAGGGVRLCVSAGAPAAFAAEAALRLQAAEDLLAPLDDWCGGELAWRWAEAPQCGVPRGLAGARWRGEASAHECMLWSPWASMLSLPPPPPSLANRLDWPLVDALLVFAQLRIEAGELRLLEPGGAVVLPASLQPPWRGLLRGAGEARTACVALDLSVPWRPRLAEPQPAPEALSAADPARVPCELRLDLPLAVSAQRLAGWRREGDTGDVVQLSEANLRVALWRCATAGGTEQALARGRLMPWGDGWAFAVETVTAQKD